jgi:hypothetical protein
LVKDGATAIETLGDSIDASLVDLKGGTSGQVLAKNSNTDMDFTWVAQDDSNAIQNAIVDAKGDLIAATAADTPARLAVGTNGALLTADSTQSTGLQWGGLWQAYTPTLAGITIGNGTVEARYCRIGNTIHTVINCTIGSTTSITGDVTFTQPVAAAYTSSGSCWLDDIGPFVVYAGVCMVVNGELYARAVNTAGTYALSTALSSTVPFTWGTNDVIRLQATYEVSA